jgi:hypothetical protein
MHQDVYVVKTLKDCLAHPLHFDGSRDIRGEYLYPPAPLTKFRNRLCCFFRVGRQAVEGYGGPGRGQFTHNDWS